MVTDLKNLTFKLTDLIVLAKTLKDRLGDQRGGREWELIKILLEGD
jgi:hypothetical protein